MAFVEEWWRWRGFLLFGWLLVGLLLVLVLVLRMDGGDYSGKEEEEGKEDAEDEVRRRGGGDMHRVLRSVV